MTTNNKTPREMAREKYPQDIATTDEAYMYSYNGLQEERQEAYLAGLEAGAKMGWEAAIDNYEGTASFDEWWAELNKEGEK